MVTVGELINTVSGNITIGLKSFRGMTKAQRIILGDRVISIDDYAFENCSGLNIVEIKTKI